MPYLPVPISTENLLKRIHEDEKRLTQSLAQIEDQIRKFEDLDRPAYHDWIRLELGSRIVALEELYNQARERQILVQRVDQLIEEQNLHPREALYLVLNKINQGSAQKKNSDPWDAEEIQARRQAKREAKREARREQKKQAKLEQKVESVVPSLHTKLDSASIVSVYRVLARKLHPDSPLAIQSLPADRILSLWLEVQSAYQSGALEKLLAISAWLDSRVPDSHPELSCLSFAERFARLRTLEKSCRKLESQLLQLKGQDAWDFLNARGNLKRKLLQKAKRELDSEFDRAQDILDQLEDFIQSIGSPRPPRGLKVRHL